MENAYDAKALVEGLKDKGMDVVEDMAGVLVEGVLDWVLASAILSENKFDDVLAGLLPAIKPYLMEQVDKIDGEKG